MYSDLIRAGRRGSEVHINSDLMPWAHVDDTDLSDSSFTLYALIRLGFTQEANAFMEFIFSHLQHRNPDGSLNIM